MSNLEFLIEPVQLLDLFTSVSTYTIKIEIQAEAAKIIEARDKVFAPR